MSFLKRYTKHFRGFMKKKTDYHQIRENAETLSRYAIIYFENETKPCNCLNCREYVFFNNMKQIFISFETKQKTSNIKQEPTCSALDPFPSRVAWKGKDRKIKVDVRLKNDDVTHKTRYILYLHNTGPLRPRTGN